MKRPSILAGVLVVLLAAVMVFYLQRPQHLVITETQINAAVQKKFPISKTFWRFDITCSDPHVTLLPETNRVEIGLDLAVNVTNFPMLKWRGSVVAASGLAYSNETKQFFLSQPTINKLTIPGIPQQYLDKVTDYVSNLAGNRLQEIPVFTWTDSRAVLVKDIQVKNGKVDVAIR